MEVLGSDAATPGTRMQAARLSMTLDSSGDDGDEYNVDDKVALWFDYIDQLSTVEQPDDLIQRVRDPAFDIHAISPETVAALAQKSGGNGNRPGRKAG